MTTPAPDLDLFISHASADDGRVSLLDHRLNDAGISTWVDHEHGIVYGDEWLKAIEAATLRSRAALFILSAASRKSEWCERELIRMGEALKRPIYVALVDAMEAWQVPMIVNNRQYANLTASTRRLPSPSGTPRPGEGSGVRFRRAGRLGRPTLENRQSLSPEWERDLGRGVSPVAAQDRSLEVDHMPFDALGD